MHLVYRTAALLEMGALHLPFCDARYSSSPSREELVRALSQVIADLAAATVILPMGLFHSVMSSFPTPASRCPAIFRA